MSTPAWLMWDEAVTRYDFGPSHPMNPVRLALTMRLVESLGLDQRTEVRAERPAGESTLRLVHRPDYVDAVRRASAAPESADRRYGLNTVDNPAFHGIHEASALIAGQSVAAAEAVWAGRTPHAVNFAGGLHHAMPGAAAGFCVYNDAALAIARLLEQGVERVAYLDVDVHHGDGVQAVFWDDPRVLTISLHESPATLPFPSTGWAEETGGGPDGGPAGAVNVPLPSGTTDGGWLRALHAVVPELLASFAPQVLVTQHGADTHRADPLADLGVTVDAQRAAMEAVHDWAHAFAAGRWLALGGGGYAVVDVVPRSWAHLVGVAAHAPVAPETAVPAEWSRAVRELTGRPGPLVMGDGGESRWRSWEDGYDPADPLDRAVRATRQAVYPSHGLLV